MRIHIENLTLDLIIGLLDFERKHPQRVIVNMEAEYRYDKDETFLDYARIVQDIETLLQRREFSLLEEAVEETAAMLHTRYPQIERLFLKIAKPDILPRCRVALSKEWIFEKK